MDILMLGHSGVGKTTFMAAMYAALQQPIDGFRVKAGKGQHKRLISLAKAIMSGHYPDATDQRSIYNLKLMYQDQAVFDFRWIDYRGNAMNESNSSADARQLVADLQGANGILTFIDASELVGGSRRVRREIGRLTALLGEAVRGIAVPTPLAVVLTKFDTVDQSKGDKMMVPLEGLASAVAASRFVHGTIVPTSCGKELVNVHLPTLFALHIGIRGKLASLEGQYESRLAAAAEAESQVGLWNDFMAWLGEAPNKRDEARSHRLSAQGVAQSYHALAKPAEGLGAYLDDLEHF